MAHRTIYEVSTIQTFATKEKADKTFQYFQNMGLVCTRRSIEIDTQPDGEKRWLAKEKMEREL